MPVSHSRVELLLALTCVADSGVVNLNADLVSPGRRDLYVLNGELLAGFPRDGSLAGDRLCKIWSVALRWKVG